MMNKLLKITDITTLLKRAQFPNYQRYKLVAQIEDSNEDCDTIYYIEKGNKERLDNLWKDNHRWKSKSKSSFIMIYEKSNIYFLWKNKKIYLE